MAFSYTNSFTNGTVANATEVNINFTDIAGFAKEKIEILGVVNAAVTRSSTGAQTDGIYTGYEVPIPDEIGSVAAIGWVRVTVFNDYNDFATVSLRVGSSTNTGYTTAGNMKQFNATGSAESGQNIAILIGSANINGIGSSVYIGSDHSANNMTTSAEGFIVVGWRNNPADSQVFTV